jgi:hypothetical protein
MTGRLRLPLTATAILSVLGVWIAWEFYAAASLSAKIVPLRERATEFDRLGKDNRRLKAEISRLRDLRRNRGEEINALALQRAEAEGRAPSGFKPANEWRNTGNSTPRQAYETYLWAIDHGDMEALARVLSLDAASQARIADVFANLSADAQAEYESPEALFALLFSNQNPVWFTAVNVVNQNQEQEGVSKLTLDYQYAGGQVREHTAFFAHSDDGWRRYVSSSEVDYILESQLGVSSPGQK